MLCIIVQIVEDRFHCGDVALPFRLDQYSHQSDEFQPKALSDVSAPALIKQEKPGLHLGREGDCFGLASIQVQEKRLGHLAVLDGMNRESENFLDRLCAELFRKGSGQFVCNCVGDIDGTVKAFDETQPSDHGKVHERGCVAHDHHS